mmetsp:Transcript_8894/g.26992  ORF Transcript_8894/g.26992 Transcript_8894/m.26992 type:complete len:491 (-) Transcript_8894:807-2279(-)
MSGVEIIIGGGALLLPLVATGCLFGSKKTAVKYAEDKPAAGYDDKPSRPQPTDSAGAAKSSQAVGVSGRNSSTSPPNVESAASVRPSVPPTGDSAVTSSGSKPAAVDSPRSKTGAVGLHAEIKTLANTLSGEANKLVLLEPIGQGGFGTVYLGRWRGLEVAVKTVVFSENNGAGMSTHTAKARVAAQPQQRAVMEAAVCTSVMHPNVVATYHYDIVAVQDNKEGGATAVAAARPATDWKLFLVQEYCNASLQDAMCTKLLHKKETMAPDMDLVLSILMDIARGLQYIHEKNIIHGDLTPGNVLLKHDSSSPIGVVGKITDFGLCSTIDPTCTHISNITNGTPYYVAPEVVECGMLTKTSDVYSFGVLMWEVYRCMPPWVKTKTGYRQNPRFRRFPSDSPHVYVVLCARCLDKNPKVRPNFTEVLAELQAMHTAYLNGYSALLDLSMTAPPAPLPAAFADTDVHVSPAAKDDTAAAPTSQAPPRSQLNIGD